MFRFSDGNRDPTPIKRCEPWYKEALQSRMKNLIDKSRMNATEKSDKFKKFSKNKRENILSILIPKSSLPKNTS